MLALYLHIPFCLSKCRYCAFNSQALPPGAAGRASIRDYLDALHREMQLAARNQTSDVRRLTPEIEGIGSTNANQNPAAGDRRPATGRESLRSVYFGGGTPTLLDPSCLSALLEQSGRCFDWDESIEITVEANPATVDRAGLAQLRRAGVNRLSLGAQSFAAQELRLLGRPHGVADIRAAYRVARAAGFHNLSLDLIYGLPGQTVAAWRQNLRQALKLEPEHLSVYGLKLEPGTPLAEDVAAGRLQECGEDEQIAMWHETRRLTALAGFERYEVSNYARPGFQSRHNLAYWHNQPCLALGAGASGYLRSEAGCQKPDQERSKIGRRAEESDNPPAMSESTTFIVGGMNTGRSLSGRQAGEGAVKAGRHAGKDSGIRLPASGFRYVRYTNHEDAGAYMAAVSRGELPRAWEERQTLEQERADTVMMGLRLTGGLDRPDFEARFGRPFEFFYGEQLTAMERDGLMGWNAASVFLTERGLLLSNYVLAHFI